MSDFFDREISCMVREHRKQPAGVGKTAVFDIEHGKASVQLKALLKVLEILNIQVQLKSPLLIEKNIMKFYPTGSKS